jgi:hypothetical protein
VLTTGPWEYSAADPFPKDQGEDTKSSNSATAENIIQKSENGFCDDSRLQEILEVEQWMFEGGKARTAVEPGSNIPPTLTSLITTPVAPLPRWLEKEREDAFEGRYMCLFIITYLYIYIYIYIYVKMYQHIYIYVHIFINTYIFLCIHMYRSQTSL